MTENESDPERLELGKAGVEDSVGLGIVCGGEDAKDEGGPAGKNGGKAKAGQTTSLIQNGSGGEGVVDKTRAVAGEMGAKRGAEWDDAR